LFLFFFFFRKYGYLVISVGDCKAFVYRGRTVFDVTAENRGNAHNPTDPGERERERERERGETETESMSLSVFSLALLSLLLLSSYLS
jgi:hypothetical protein